MLMLKSELEDPYVPFVSSRHSSLPIHEIRRRDHHVGAGRRTIGKALIRAGLSVAGLNASSNR
jgi:hypothetical protein